MSAMPAWRATYRLQFHTGFTFDDARAVLPYLKRLGISHVYASPIQAARRGSRHGYDQVDPTRINPELGGEDAFRRFSDALRAEGMGLLVDIVPNHMAADRSNPWWMAALAGGAEGAAAGIFDIDWDRHGQVLQPVLGDTLADSLAQGAISLGVDDDAGWIVVAAYGEHAWPLRVEDAAAQLDAAGLHGLGALWREDTTLDMAEARAALRALDGPSRARLDAELAAQDLAALIDRQHWRPVHWRSGRDALSARRFFNINELVGVRVESPEVFALTHRLPLALLREGRIDGLRVDHIDGLADPAGYCTRLRAETGPDALIVVEKILGAEEALRPDWPIDGTTGYERLNQINRLFVAPAGYRRLRQALEEDAGVSGDPASRLSAAKRQLLDESFAPELERLAEEAARMAAAEPAVEFAAPTLREALAGLLTHFPVYRSYVVTPPASATDRALHDTAFAALEAKGDPWTIAAAAWLRDLILDADGEPAAAFRCRFQQLTGPLMAKGLEDTELYRDVALASVNEVGGDPQEPALDSDVFHAWAARRAEREPRDLTPLATHDTKRGAETRARINLLSLMPEAWIGAVAHWRGMNAALRSGDAPDALDEWLIYQTLFGAWPIEAARLEEYVTKAMREAKRFTRWENPNPAYEEPVLAFARALLEDPRASRFRDEMSAMVQAAMLAGRRNALAQTVLHLTLPGVPDVYQGTEFWDLSLVDPDNRRPVDFGARERGLDAALPELRDDEQGLIKQRIVERLLELRRSDPELLRGYEAADPQRPGWLAFTRGDGGLLVVVQLDLRADLEIPGPPASGRWHNVVAEVSERIGGGIAVYRRA